MKLIKNIENTYANTKGDNSIISYFNELSTKEKKKIDSLTLSTADTRIYFVNIIGKLIGATTKAPSLIDNKEIRNTIQAYTHMASAKESLRSD